MILLTGASGFIGKHLLNALVKVYGKENVIAFTSVPLEGCQYLLHNNYDFDGNFFKNSGYGSIDTIIHAGAFIPKSGKEINNIKECNSNISNTQKLIDSDFARLKKIIFLSTVDVYGNAETISEKSIIDPVSLYGMSKYYCERVIEVFGKERSLVTQILRVGHVYGPGEEAYQKIIPITFKKLLNNQPLQIWGTGEEKRSFIYINDVINSILSSIMLDESIGPVNIVGTQAVSIRQLLDIMIEISGVRSLIETLPATNEGRNLVFDNSRMKEFLLNSETPLQTGLSEEWKYMQRLYL